MIPITSAVSGTLTWTNLSRKTDYEIKLNDGVVGTLHRQSFWFASLWAETADGQWMIRRAGLFGTEILEKNSGQSVAMCKWVWGGKGRLRFSDGQTFYVGGRGLLRRVWTVTSEAGQPVATLSARDKTVELLAGGFDGRVSLLVLFALYCIWRTEEDAAMVAVVAAT